jgi:hypothetical protein
MQRLTALILGMGMLAALAGAWLLHDAPFAPGAARGLLRADGLSALFALLAASQLLAEQAAGRGGPPGRRLLVAGLLAAAYLSGDLAAMAGLLAAAAAVRAWGRRPAAALPAALPAACGALGVLSLGLRAGEWRYAAAEMGAGLNSGAFALLLLAALLAAGGLAVVSGEGEGPARQLDQLAGAAALYPLLRLYSLGPWNPGWAAACTLLGGGLALWAAGRAAWAEPAAAEPWLARYSLGLALAGAGLGTGAGLALTGYALLCLPLLSLAMGGRPGRPLWALCAATPLSTPFLAAWAGVAAATAAGAPLLAVGLWAAGLLAAVPLARLAMAGPPAGSLRLRTAAGLSMLLGVGAPAALWLLIDPLVAQLQGGLSPLGEIVVWPWAGLLALNAARQPVASLPTLALAALMLIMAALAWIGARLLARRGE